MFLITWSGCTGKLIKKEKTVERIYLALAALLGGLLIAMAGWWDAKEPFDKQKFGATVIRTLFAAVVFAVGYPLTGALTMNDLFLAFTAATTFDVVVNKISGALGNAQFPLSKPPGTGV
jgi:hypothetical protein